MGEVESVAAHLCLAPKKWLSAHALLGLAGCFAGAERLIRTARDATTN